MVTNATQRRRLACTTAAVALLAGAALPSNAQTLMRANGGAYSPQTFFFADTTLRCRAADPACVSLAQLDFEMYRMPLPAPPEDVEVCDSCSNAAATSTPASPAPATASATRDALPSPSTTVTPPGGKRDADVAAPTGVDAPSDPVVDTLGSPDPLALLLEQILHDTATDSALADLDLGAIDLQDSADPGNGLPPVTWGHGAGHGVAVPEPPPLALLLCAALAAAAARRRRVAQRHL